MFRMNKNQWHFPTMTTAENCTVRYNLIVVILKASSRLYLNGLCHKGMFIVAINCLH